MALYLGDEEILTCYVGDYKVPASFLDNDGVFVTMTIMEEDGANVVGVSVNNIDKYSKKEN